MNVVRVYEEWRTPDESWLDMDSAEKGKILFVNMAFGEQDDNGEKDVLQPMEEYKE